MDFSGNSMMRRVLTGGVHLYRSAGFLWKPCCRFWPTCSQYALDALEGHNALTAVGLIVRRLARCRPGGGSGFDPVPRGACDKRDFPVEAHGLNGSSNPSTEVFS